jgi:tRNA uridine 5-carboxymethylaminomethyl modification enzyme
VNSFDVIVVGAGHAGIEAALASARLGLRTACITMRLDRIGHLPCNCSIGGPAKGHIAREIDALGGQMGVTTDYALTHIRRVGTSRGPSVQTVRAHVCKDLYPKLMQETMGAQSNLTLIEATVETIVTSVEVEAVLLTDGSRIECKSVILTTGTFLNGLCHEGQKKTIAARHGDQASLGLSGFLASIGVNLRRFKTGTTPRIRYSSIDFSKTETMESEPFAGPISFRHDTIFPAKPLLPCWQTHTNAQMHDLIRGRLHESAMYSGQIKGVGPRYCPSIEDKIVRFADKTSHPVFFEVEDWQVDSVYVQGMSTSLPAETQLAMLRMVDGLAQVEMIRPGYAVEYDMADPLQLTPHLMSKLMPGLFLAGQLNGTSGYEEAAGQGLVAGINAARYVKGEAPLDFPRSQSFVGVMIDDLVTKGVDDPYRMLTARAEHRLTLRHDNADTRLTPVSKAVGLCDPVRWERFEKKQDLIAKGCEHIQEMYVSPADSNVFEALDLAAPKTRISYFELMRRPEIGLSVLEQIARATGSEWHLEGGPQVLEQIELAGMYAGYLEREDKFQGNTQKMEEMRIPPSFDFSTLKGLSHESKDKLSRVRPLSIGQASRIPGVRVTDIALLIGNIKARNAK